MASNPPPANVISTLQQTSGLDTLNNFINGSTTFSNLLLSAQEFTFLAPSDDAFKTWLASQGSNVSMDVIEATLTYHLLNGSFATVSITDKPQFAPTYLQNQSYSNITISPPGQRVELVEGSNGQLEILSNNKNVTGFLNKACVSVKCL